MAPPIDASLHAVDAEQVRDDYEAARNGWGSGHSPNTAVWVASPLAPHMELIAGRFVHEPQRRLSGEVKAKLGPRARGGAGDRAGKTAVDRAVQMAAEDALNLGIAHYDRGERLGVL